MAIAFTNLGSSATPDTTGSGSSLVTGSWTPPTSGLIVAFVGQKRAGAAPSLPTSITGNSLTWTRIASSVNTTANIRVTIFGANASGSSTGATTINMTESQFMGFVSFFQATDVDLSGGVAAAFVQTPGNTADSTASVSVTLAAAANAANRPIAGFILDANDAITPTWTEADELINSRNLETQWKDDAFSTTASATITPATNYWAAIAAELKCATPASSARRLALLGVG